MKMTFLFTVLVAALSSLPLRADTFTGIGAMLKALPDGSVSISQLIAGGPAEKSGAIKPGDVFVAIEEADGTLIDLQRKNVAGIAQKVRGPIDSKIVLHLKRGDETVKVPLARGTVKTAAPQRPEMPPIGSDAPDISWIRLSDNATEKVSAHKGKVIVIDFWATWCGPCQKPMAKMQSYVEKHPEFAGKAVFVACSVDKDRARLEKHLAAKGWNLTHNVWDDDNENDAYGVSGIPSVCIIDTNGKIAAQGHPVSLDIPQIVADLLKKAEQK